MTPALFMCFALFTLLCAFVVILATNPVYSAFALILTFFGLSGLYLLWGSPFIAMIQILVYTGAIVVLFVFVVMLINLNKKMSYSYSWLTFGVASILTFATAKLLLQTLSSETISKYLKGETTSGTLRGLSKLLFTHYLWPFEVLSLFLLVMIIAVFALTRPLAHPQEGDRKQ